MTDTTELKPCPFCGGELDLCVNDSGARYVSHPKAECILSRKIFRGHNAVALINTRPATPNDTANKVRSQHARPAKRLDCDMTDTPERIKLIVAQLRSGLDNADRHPDGKREMGGVLSTMNEAASMLEALTAALTKERDALREAQTWQPIETAPKGATDCILTYSPVGMDIAWWSEGENDWLTVETGTYLAGDPTHWQPLPIPPTKEKL